MRAVLNSISIVNGLSSIYNLLSCSKRSFCSCYIPSFSLCTFIYRSSNLVDMWFAASRWSTSSILLYSISGLIEASCRSWITSLEILLLDRRTCVLRIVMV
jgi:hypothetical protein